MLNKSFNTSIVVNCLSSKIFFTNMSRSTFKKGNKGSCEGIIPFYTKDNKKKNKDSSDEEGSKRIKAKTIKIQLKLDTSKDCKNDNAFTFHLKQIKQLK